MVDVSGESQQKKRDNAEIRTSWYRKCMGRVMKKSINTFQWIPSYMYIWLVKSPHLDGLIHLRVLNIIAKEGGRQRLPWLRAHQQELITGYGTKRGMWTGNWRCKDQELLKLKSSPRNNKEFTQKLWDLKIFQMAATNKDC